MTQTPPPERLDPDPPDLDLALVVVLRLLLDVERHLATGKGDRAELVLRLAAVASVLRRIQALREAGP